MVFGENYVPTGLYGHRRNTASASTPEVSAAPSSNTSGSTTNTPPSFNLGKTTTQQQQPSLSGSTSTARDSLFYTPEEQPPLLGSAAYYAAQEQQSLGGSDSTAPNSDNSDSTTSSTPSLSSFGNLNKQLEQQQPEQQQQEQQKQQQPPLFGSTSTAGNTAFGSTTTAQQQPTNTAQQQPSLFGTNNTTQSQQKPPLFGSTSTGTQQQPSLFGSTSTNNTAFGSGTTNTQSSLFGTTSTNAGSGTTTNAQPSLFGSAATGNQTQGTSSFGFGNTTFGSSTTNTANQPSSLFGASQQPQQPQRQVTSGLLGLQSAFPDTNVPYFIIRPDGINRTTLPSNALGDRTTSDSTHPESTNSSGQTFYYKGKETTIFESINAQSQLDGSNSSSTTSPSSRNYRGKRKVLPGFLTGSSAQTTENARAGQKRFSDNNDDLTRRVLTKSLSVPTSASGVFGSQLSRDSSSFHNGATEVQVVDTPPVLSLWHTHTGPKPAARPAILGDPIQETKNVGNMNNQDSTGGSSTAVSVFGYPPEMKNQILDYYKTFGEIVSTVEIAMNGMAITYKTQQSAEKALETSGKVLPNNTMVGVTRLMRTETPSAPVARIPTATATDKTPFRPSNGTFGIFTPAPTAQSSNTPSSSSGFTTTTSSLASSKSSDMTTNLGQPVVRVGESSFLTKIKYALGGW